MRNIDDSIWRDEWFAAQEIIGRLLWIGFLSRVADDQGRFLDNAELIKSDVFPMDKINADEIDLWVTWFATDGKVERYVAGGKKLIQIVNWWKYQASSSWMAKSKYSPPENWEDHWRFHGKGRIPMQSQNWALRSGLGTPLGRDLDTPLRDQEVNEDVKEEEEGNDARKEKPAQKGATAAYFLEAGYADANRVLLAACGLSAVPADQRDRLDSVYAMIAAHGKDACSKALTEAKTAWVKTPKKPGNGGGFYSVLNFSWVDWASEYLSTGVKHWEPKEGQPATVSTLPNFTNYVDPNEGKYVPNPSRIQL